MCFSNYNSTSNNHTDKYVFMFIYSSLLVFLNPSYPVSFILIIINDFFLACPKQNVLCDVTCTEKHLSCRQVFNIDSYAQYVRVLDPKDASCSCPTEDDYIFQESSDKYNFCNREPSCTCVYNQKTYQVTNPLVTKLFQLLCHKGDVHCFFNSFLKLSQQRRNTQILIFLSICGSSAVLYQIIISKSHISSLYLFCIKAIIDGYIF